MATGQVQQRREMLRVGPHPGPRPTDGEALDPKTPGHLGPRQTGVRPEPRQDCRTGETGGNDAGRSPTVLTWFLRYRGYRGTNFWPSEGQPEVISSYFVSLIPIRFGARQFRLPPPSADVRCDDNHRQDGHGAYQGDQPYRRPLLRFRRRRRGQGRQGGRWGRRRCGRRRGRGCRGRRGAPAWVPWASGVGVPAWVWPWARAWLWAWRGRRRGRGVAVGVGVGVAWASALAWPWAPGLALAGVGSGPVLMLESPTTVCSTLFESSITPEKE